MRTFLFSTVSKRVLLISLLGSTGVELTTRLREGTKDFSDPESIRKHDSFVKRLGVLPMSHEKLTLMLVCIPANLAALKYQLSSSKPFVSLVYVEEL